MERVGDGKMVGFWDGGGHHHNNVCNGDRYLYVHSISGSLKHGTHNPSLSSCSLELYTPVPAFHFNNTPQPKPSTPIPALILHTHIPPSHTSFIAIPPPNLLHRPTNSPNRASPTRSRAPNYSPRRRLAVYQKISRRTPPSQRTGHRRSIPHSPTLHTTRIQYYTYRPPGAFLQYHRSVGIVLPLTKQMSSHYCLVWVCC